MKPKDDCKTKPFTIHLTSELDHFLTATSRETGQSKGEIVRDLLIPAARAYAIQQQKRKAKRQQHQPFQDMKIAIPGSTIFWSTGPDGRASHISREWTEHTGRAPRDDLGEAWASSVHPEDRDDVMRIFTNSLNDRTPYNFEFRLRRPDGGYNWVHAQATPHFDSDGNFLGHIGTTVAITSADGVMLMAVPASASAT